ncbi:MAG: site-specific integrase [Candidatus Bathyarchaeia archaeon]
MKHHIGLTIDAELLKKIEQMRGLTKRSTFIEYLLRLGINLEVEKRRAEIKSGRGSTYTYTHYMRIIFRQQRRKIAKKLGNPRLLQITFHTLRHWKATMEYHKTKDILYIKEILGHKNINNTQIYVHIEKALFQNAPPEEYHVKIAKTPEEITQLLEAGFEYVCQKDGLAFFRKRK